MKKMAWLCDYEPLPSGKEREQNNRYTGPKIDLKARLAEILKEVEREYKLEKDRESETACCVCLDDVNKHFRWECRTCVSGLICKCCYKKMRKKVRQCPVCRVSTLKKK